MHQIGLVLSGGGMLGAAHIGVIKALHEHGIHPTCLAGSSIGSVVSALYASDNTIEQMTSFFKDLQKLPKYKLAFSLRALADIAIIGPILKKYINHDDFDELTIPLTVCITNLNTMLPEYITAGPILDVLLASSAVPFIFKPVKIGQNTYVDGGVTDNLPIQSIKDKCDKIISVNLRPIQPVTSDFTNAFQIINRVLATNVAFHSTRNEEDANLKIDLSGIDQFSMFKFDQIDDLIEFGYTRAMNCLSAEF